MPTSPSWAPAYRYIHTWGGQHEGFHKVCMYIPLRVVCCIRHIYARRDSTNSRSSKCRVWRCRSEEKSLRALSSTKRDRESVDARASHNTRLFRTCRGIGSLSTAAPKRCTCSRSIPWTEARHIYDNLHETDVPILGSTIQPKDTL